MIFLLGVPILGALSIGIFTGVGKKKIHFSLPAKGIGLLVVILFLSVSVIGAAQYRDDCQKVYPNPQIKFDRIDTEGRVYIPVINWSSYDNQMFRQAPDLPPCGANTNSARTWVDIYNADTNGRVYGFCAFDSNDDLKGIWFKGWARSGRVYIILIDRACKKKYRSNIVVWPRRLNK